MKEECRNNADKHADYSRALHYQYPTAELQFFFKNVSSGTDQAVEHDGQKSNPKQIERLRLIVELTYQRRSQEGNCIQHQAASRRYPPNYVEEILFGTSLILNYRLSEADLRECLKHSYGCEHGSHHSKILRCQQTRKYYIPNKSQCIISQAADSQYAAGAYAATDYAISGEQKFYDPVFVVPHSNVTCYFSSFLRQNVLTRPQNLSPRRFLMIDENTIARVLIILMAHISNLEEKRYRDASSKCSVPKRSL